MKKTINIFTLMELLIVIAMIAILASLLLPALNSAQKKAMGIQCSNQLKQHLTALISYTSDYDDWSFCAGMGLPGVNTTGFQWYGMVNFIQNVRHSNGSFHNNTRIGIFRCPLDTSRTSTGGIYQNYGYNGRHEAYHTDQSSSNPWRGMDFRKIGKIKHPSHLMWIGEGKPTSYGGNAVSYTNAQGTNPGITNLSQLKDTMHHGGTSGNYGMVDGHVSTLTYSKVAEEFQAGVDSFFYDTERKF